MRPRQKTRRPIANHDYDSRTFRALTDQGRAQVRQIDRINEWRYRGIRVEKAKPIWELMPFRKCTNCQTVTLRKVTFEFALETLQRRFPDKPWGSVLPGLRERTWTECYTCLAISTL